MSKVKRGLGKGIGALLGDTDTNEIPKIIFR